MALPLMRPPSLCGNKVKGERDITMDLLGGKALMSGAEFVWGIAGVDISCFAIAYSAIIQDQTVILALIHKNYAL